METFDSKDFKINLGMSKVIVRLHIAKDGLSKSNVDRCGVCCLRVKVNSALCVQSSKWIHSGCARLKRMTPNFLNKLYMLKM